VNYEIYRPAEKKNWVVFLGRLEAAKNALALVRLVPKIARYLLDGGIPLPRFFFLGDGEEAEDIRQLISGADYRDLNIVVGRIDVPHEILMYAKVFLSLQRTSNYPSKALVEAMACGCLPVITDVGESRMMADTSFARFVQSELDGDELAKAIAELIGLPEAVFNGLSEQAVDFAKRTFTVDAQASYFANLYWDS
jgi:poly(glycerol-phosphate) alpha-glucosyltransferase